LKSIFERLLNGASAGEGQRYVMGSGLVPVPRDRLTEIPRVIGEHHSIAAERARQLAAARVSQAR